MSGSGKILLVEGDADKFFYKACLREVGMANVIVGPPHEFDGTGTGKGNVLTLLPALLTGMEDGRISHLAIIVDADYSKENGLGYDKTLEKVLAILKPYGFNIPDKIKAEPKGHIFTHPDGLPDFGLWVMPNNQDPGFLEDFILNSAINTESKLIHHAKQTITALTSPKFKDLHKNKAHVATWLAWQAMPGQGLHSVIGGKLINTKKGLANDFLMWLKRIYR